MSDFNSFRDSDRLKETVVSDFLWTALYNKPPFFCSQKITDFKQQLLGVDTIIDIPSLQITNGLVDEKAQVYYLDGGRPTFAFELNFLLKNGERVEGWFTDVKKITEYYLLIWIKTADCKTLKTKTDIEYVDYALIARKTLFEYLATQKITIKILVEIGLTLAVLEEGSYGRDAQRDYYFFYSAQLAEKPVNLIIRKAKLYSLALLKGRVYALDKEE